MDFKLKVLDGKNAGHLIAINVKRFLIGRAEDCQLRPGSELVSRHHCALLREDGYVGVRDFGSRNGTFVNDQRIAGEQELHAGDRLQVGPLRFEVLLDVAVGGKKRPPVADLKEAAVRTAETKTDGVDVTQWLVDAADVTPGPSVKETERIPFSDTGYVPTGSTAAAEAAAAPETPTEPSASEPQPPPAAPGKLPPMPKQTGKNSQDAASAVLNKLRRRR